MKDIAIYGAGGYGCEVACLIKAINTKYPKWNLIGFFDDTKSIGERNLYGPILGGMNELNKWSKELSIVIAIGSPDALINLTGRIVNPLISYPNLIAPDVVFYDEDSVKWGKGNVVLFRSIISCYTGFGDFNLINTDVLIGHDSKLGSWNVLNPSVRISGNVEVGDGNFFGVCSAVLQQIKIGNNTKIGAGSCLFRKTKDNSLYMGNPAVQKIVPIK
jgi:sugar O-acyltransferase (sialic acid O-acetyltransferase NeuD family)